MGLRIFEQGCAPVSQQRTQGAPPRLGHGGRSAYAATTKKVMQNSLRLVIRMVCKKYPVGGLVRQGLVAQPARRGFKSLAGPRGNLYTAHGDRNAETRAKLAAGSGPGVGVAAEPVMNVERGKAKTCPADHAACRMKQYSRIESAGKAHQDRLPWPGVTGKAGGYRLRDGFSGWLVP